MALGTAKTALVAKNAVDVDTLGLKHVRRAHAASVVAGKNRIRLLLSKEAAVAVVIVVAEVVVGRRR